MRNSHRKIGRKKNLNECVLRCIDWRLSVPSPVLHKQIRKIKTGLGWYNLRSPCNRDHSGDIYYYYYFFFFDKRRLLGSQYMRVYYYYTVLYCALLVSPTAALRRDDDNDAVTAGNGRCKVHAPPDQVIMTCSTPTYFTYVSYTKK